MVYICVIFILLTLSTLTQEQSDSDTSFTKSTWFWPVFGVCVALLILVPCSVMTVFVICHLKSKSDDDSEDSHIGSHSSASSSSPPIRQERRHRHTRGQRSHFVQGFRSPPPPYPASEGPHDVFVTPSLPPPYDVAIAESAPINNPSTTNNAQTRTGEARSAPRPLDNSSVSAITSPSIQTFHV